MNSTLERLTEEFTQLIGPEAFAKARAAQAEAATAAKAAAEKVAAAAAKAAAEKAAAAVVNPMVPATTPAPAAARPVSAAVPPVVARPAATPPPGVGATAAPAVAPRPVPPPAPSLAVPPPLPVQAVAHASKGFDIDAVVAPEQVVTAAQLLDRDGFALDAITGVDWMAQNEMEVVYDYFHPSEPVRVVVRTRVARLAPEVPTISRVFPGANWHERETHDFFGIRFTGHPNLKPFLLPEDANFHPLRKDYQP